MSALIGREEEFRKIEAYVQEWLNESNAMCLFVNGVPGTGKTVTVDEVVKKFLPANTVEAPKTKGRPAKRKLDKSFTHVYVNCHGLTKQVDLCNAILEALGKTAKKLTVRTAIADTESVLLKVKTLLILDEIDSLKTLGSALFNKVFGWPSNSDGNVFIIGISNMLNIVDSCLQKRNLGDKPKVVTFKAYTSKQITDILMERLKTKMEDTEVKAIELCAKKVAAMTGDIRRAFTLADAMINMRPPTEQLNIGLSTPRKGERPNDENMPPSTPTHPSTPKTPRTPASACRDAIRLFNQVEASPVVRAKLPFQPKFILACILNIFGKSSMKGRAQTVTKQEVFNICERAAKKLKLESCPPEGIAEGLDILSMQGMITIGKDQKIRVVVQASAARLVIADNDLIAQINEISV